MKPMNSSIAFGKERIPFEVLFSKRKTMEIAVHPDQRVVVKAPAGIDMEIIQERMVRRARWIKRQRDYFAQFAPRTPAPLYLGGATHLYMGRQYRLKISADGMNQVKLAGGFFRATVAGSPAPDRVKQLMEKWYAQKAGERFQEILNRCLPGFERAGIPVLKLSVRRMKTRWGSLSPKGTLSLNVDLIRAPRECIEYVITHELCHLKHRGHDAAFYKLLEQRMPDWKRRKHKLELSLA
jgi:predicted metal-dependent hydrolase